MPDVEDTLTVRIARLGVFGEGADRQSIDSELLAAVDPGDCGDRSAHTRDGWLR